MVYRICRLLVTLALVTLFAPAPVADSGADHQALQVRPIQLGTSGGNIYDRSMLYCCSGTLGALVEDGAGNQYILSNNHVLARFNQGQPGEPVNQPGQIDQSCGQDGHVATLSAFVPIAVSKGRTVQWNTVDAAIAAVIPGAVLTNGAILDIGPLSGKTAGAFVGQAVQKSGRTTGHTTGSVLTIDVTTSVGYSKECGGAANQIAYFQNQLRIGGASFSAAGDSGSLVVESGSTDPETGLPRAVGLLFAGDSSSTLANPIGSALSALGVTLVGGAPVPPAPAGSIAGVVTDADTASPIANATVSAGALSAATDAAGAYFLDNVPEGIYTVTVSATGYEPSSQAGVVVVENQTTVQDFQLTPSPSATVVLPGCVIYNTAGGKNKDKDLIVSIKVVDNFGAPVAGAAVNIRIDRNGSLYGTGSGATTNSNGVAAYTARSAPAGTYVTTVTNITAAGLTFAGPGATPANSFTKGTDPVPAEFCAEGVSPNGATSKSDTVTLARARAANARSSARLLALEGVVGHGVGAAANGAPVIEVFVLKSASAAARAAVPAAVDGVPVRIVTTDGFVAY